ncbi:MAG: SAM-dependent methyltransferase [Alphaproteobacteria bacterium]|nr:SAM-dependent methyltransferase [Alphaproteobacteria bacterium]
MTALLAIVRDIIADEGPITVARYMELALQHPEHGYYRNHDPLGKDGDFVTAPEISQMFGELIGLWCAEAWQQSGRPDSFVLLELGPGRGTLLQDALRATEKIAGFHRAMRLVMIECNAALRKQQQEKLTAHKPEYIGGPGQLPSMPLLFVANEFFDALPVRQFVKTQLGWRERLVDFQDGKLAFAEGEVLNDFFAEDIVAAIPRKVMTFPAPCVPRSGSETEPPVYCPANANEAEDHERLFYETSPQSLGLMQQLSAHIARHGGAGLIVDYGYAAPPGMETLQAVSRHQFADVLTNPGEADLTTHVDFSALKLIAGHEGAHVAGPVGQGAFLRALGIELRAKQLKHNAAREQSDAVDAALHRLTDADQMGVLFKVMGVLSPDIKETAGFP